MLVPAAGNYNAGEVNRRTIPPIPKSLKNQDPKRFPPVYVFNVGPRRHELPPGEQGARFIEACPAGKEHSEPIMLRNIEMTIYDLADGAGNMGRLDEEGLDVAYGIIHGGPNGAGLALDTPNLEWLGVFITANEKPTKNEIEDAKKKLRAYMRLVYDTGSSHKLRGTTFPATSKDPDIYNEAAAFLGQQPLFGVSEHTMDRCVFCQESIVSGAVLCKHCGSRQDSNEAKELRKKVA